MSNTFTEADSIDEWVRLGDDWEAAARATAAQGLFMQAWSIAGQACECYLKAVAMKRLRLNSWPSRDACRQRGLSVLYTHNLQAIAASAGLLITPDDDIAPAWSIVLQWQRHHMYAPGRQMPENVAADLMEAALGPKGVAAWLRAQI